MFMSLIIIKQYRLWKVTAYKPIYNVQTADGFSENQYLVLTFEGDSRR